MMSNTTKLLIALVVITIIVVYVFGRKESTKPDDRFESSWHAAINDKNFIKISRIIVKNRSAGCGEMYIKESSENANEYLLACSSDGKNFTYYLVWPNIDKIMGVKDEGFAKPNE